MTMTLQWTRDGLHAQQFCPARQHMFRAGRHLGCSASRMAILERAQVPCHAALSQWNSRPLRYDSLTSVLQLQSLPIICIMLKLTSDDRSEIVASSAAAAASATTAAATRNPFVFVVLPTAITLMLCNMDRICMSVAILPMAKEFAWPASVQV